MFERAKVIRKTKTYQKLPSCPEKHFKLNHISSVHSQLSDGFYHEVLHGWKSSVSTGTQTILNYTKQFLMTFLRSYLSFIKVCVSGVIILVAYYLSLKKIYNCYFGRWYSTIPCLCNFLRFNFCPLVSLILMEPFLFSWPGCCWKNNHLVQTKAWWNCNHNPHNW